MEWNWGKLTDSDAWKQSLANLLRRGEDVGQYIAEAPNKAGQAILEGHAKNQALQAKAFSNPNNPLQVTDYQAMGELGDRMLQGPLGFAPVGMFIGPSAKGWSAENVFKAAQMEKAGKTPEEIWQATGTARGLDNNWRQEIPDVNVPVLNYGTAKELNKYPRMEDFLGHKELYESYGPILSKAPIGNDKAEFTKDFWGKPQVGGASFNQRTNEYTVSPRPYGATGSEYAIAQKNALLHELQHGIQKQEDWARGGNVNMFTQQKDAETARDILNLRKELNSERFKNLTNDEKETALKAEYKKAGIENWLPSQETINLAHDVEGNPNSQLEALVNLYGLNKSTTARNPTKMYEHLAGEAEARLTQNRMDLTAEQRKQHFPFKEGKKNYGLDINPEDAIIMNEGDNIVTRKQLLEQLLNKQK